MLLNYCFSKHQLFEKNLLDNYVANQQQKQLESQESYDEYEASDQLDTNSQEDWCEEADNADNLLPSKASWGTSKEDKNINTYMNDQSPSEYPVLEARKPSPKQDIEVPVASAPEISRPVTTPLTTPKSIPPMEACAKSNIQKEGMINSGFSTGLFTCLCIFSDIDTSNPWVDSDDLLMGLGSRPPHTQPLMISGYIISLFMFILNISIYPSLKYQRRENNATKPHTFHLPSFHVLQCFWQFLGKCLNVKFYVKK